eukprot:TRINITY_DN25137_c0_g2_i1.p1 TRINITY_DN25137_c0_g2~~TRINITY_DN25137_c0_g2_i1.p1  ORF type:complete len:281 (-),score=47.35 TRINITY_DN25137_c0_g2_i1:64-855(-)
MDDDDQVSLSSVLIGLVHIGSIIYLIRLCCQCSRAPPAVRLSPDAARETVDASFLQPRKQVQTSYFLWLFGAVFPMHHFYLGRLVHGMIATWTLNFCGIGWVLDAFFIPRYVRTFNKENCAENAPYDNSRRKLFCQFPLLVFGMLGGLLAFGVYLPTLLHHMQVVDLDRVAAQTQVNPYELLGISSSASLAEAKAAYRKESLKWHPDRNQGCGKECDDKMAEIGKAFELIKKRKAPPPPDRSWGGWAQDIGKDWLQLIELLSK